MTFKLLYTSRDIRGYVYRACGNGRGQLGACQLPCNQSDNRQPEWSRYLVVKSDASGMVLVKRKVTGLACSGLYLDD